MDASVLFSLQVAAWVLPLHALVGLGLAQWLARGWRGAAVVDTLVSMPMVFPPVVIGFGLLWLLGQDSPLGRFLSTLGVTLVFNLWGVVLAAFIAGLPLVAKTTQQSLQSLPRGLHEASLTLGRSPWATFWRVSFPLVLPTYATGLLLATARALGEVGITLMLGGNILGRTETVSLAIYNAVMIADNGRALALSLGLGVVAAGVLVINRFWAQRHLERLGVQGAHSGASTPGARGT